MPCRAVVAVSVGRVGVAGVVAKHVVAPMGGHPAGHRALNCHGAKDSENDLRRPTRSEAAVGEQPVEPDGDPKAGDHVEDESDHDVGQIDGVPP